MLAERPAEGVESTSGTSSNAVTVQPMAVPDPPEAAPPMPPQLANFACAWTHTHDCAHAHARTHAHMHASMHPHSGNDRYISSLAPNTAYEVRVTAYNAAGKYYVRPSAAQPCTNLRMGAHTHARTHTCTHACTHTCTHATHLCMHARMHAHRERASSHNAAEAHAMPASDGSDRAGCR